MLLTVTTDLERITALVNARLAADPVRSTVLGTIRLRLTERECWCAVTRAGGIALRSGPEYPVQMDGSWLPAELDDLATELSRMPELRGIAGPLAVATEVVQRMVVEPRRRTAMRLFRLAELYPPEGVPGQARRATSADHPIVRAWYALFAAESGAEVPDLDHVVDQALTTGGCWLWQDLGGNAVSMATRRPANSGSARIGPVYTPPEHRAHGYGSAVTAAATTDVLSEKAIPVLFTDLANPTSNSIYHRLGYRPVEDRLQVEFR